MLFDRGYEKFGCDDTGDLPRSKAMIVKKLGLLALPVLLSQCGVVDLGGVDSTGTTTGVPQLSEPRLISCCYTMFFGSAPINGVCDYNEGCRAGYVCVDEALECFDTNDSDPDNDEDLYAFCQQKCDAAAPGVMPPWGVGAAPFGNEVWYTRNTPVEQVDEGGIGGMPYEFAEGYNQESAPFIGCQATQPASHLPNDPTAADTTVGDGGGGGAPDLVMCLDQRDGCLSVYQHDWEDEPECAHNATYENPEPCGWFLPSHRPPPPEDDNICLPAPLVDYPLLAAPATHEAFLPSLSGDVEIEVSGATFDVDYNLSLAFALDDCQSGGVDGGTCELVISRLQAEIHSITMSGGLMHFDVDASLRMPDVAVASVFFDECSMGACVGDFEFSQAESNPLSLYLSWTQVNSANSNSASAGMRISNDGTTLGGGYPVYGTISVDPTASSGTIILSGSADDTLGGESATVDFTLFGYVETLDVDPGDCCETHLTGGCSNHYIKACVATRIPTCYTTEWDQTCVENVETLRCGTCPD